MTAAMPIYRADVIGSMLRPRELADARAAFHRGQLDRERLREVEDRAVDRALRIQEEAGVDVVTDGEMRRDIFFDFFASGTEGLVPHQGWVVRFHNTPGDDAFQVQMPFAVTEKIRPRGSPALTEYEYARAHTELPVKVTVPSPTLISAFWAADVSADAYPDVFDLIADATAIVKHWIVELAQAGCRYIQIDAPELNEVYADPAVRRDYTARGISPERFMAEGAAFLNEVTRVDLPAGTVLGVHVCKGNGTQSWIAQGGYEDIARDVFSRRTGSTCSCSSTTTNGRVRSSRCAICPTTRSRYSGWSRRNGRRSRTRTCCAGESKRRAPISHSTSSALATQCGFASAAEVAEQRMITEQTEVDKLRLVAQTARSVWGERDQLRSEAAL